MESLNTLDLDKEQAALLQTVVQYMENDGAFLPGHRLMELAYRLYLELIPFIGDSSLEDYEDCGGEEQKGGYVDYHFHVGDCGQDPIPFDGPPLHGADKEIFLSQIATLNAKLQECQKEVVYFQHELEEAKKTAEQQTRAGQDAYNLAIDTLLELVKSHETLEDFQKGIKAERRDKETVLREMVEIRAKLQAAETNVGALGKMLKAERRDKQDALRKLSISQGHQVELGDRVEELEYMVAQAHSFITEVLALRALICETPDIGQEAYDTFCSNCTQDDCPQHPSNTDGPIAWDKTVELTPEFWEKLVALQETLDELEDLEQEGIEPDPDQEYFVEC